MKRYLLFLFSGDNPYDNLGWRAFHGSYDTPEDAMSAFTEETGNHYDYYGHIVDTQPPDGKAVLLVNNGSAWEDAKGSA